MRKLLGILATAVVLAAGFGGAVQAQGYDPVQAEMMRLDAEIERMMADEYARIAAMQQESDRQAIAYYRERTGDHQTPDPVAAERGRQLYCQDHAAYCEQLAESWGALSARGHQMRMDDIASFGRTTMDIGRTNQGILDMSQAGHLGRQEATSVGQAGYVQGAIQGEWTFGDPSTGMGYALPVQPDPQMRYETPEGHPLSFDYRTGTWYVGDANGFWRPLQPRR